MVSVLITAYNREKYIEDSVQSILNSRFQDFELIIVDDCSTDSTYELSNNLANTDSRIRVFRNERNLGDYPNRNRAATYATRKYLKYVDSDDKIFPETLGIMVEAMETYSQAAFCISARPHEKLEISPILLNPYESYYQHFFKDGFMDNGPLAVMIRRECFEAIGGFTGKRMIGDVECWLKLASRYPVIRINGGLVFWRQHEEQEFNKGFDYYLVEGLRVYAEALNRKDCPLSQEEIQVVIKRKKKEHYNYLFRFLLKRQEFNKSLSLFKQLRNIQ
ncbi:glycosyltransferase family 2 protein [Flavihumibacter profundi]|uniref:glycosyltransferase family 2 protein n=1 Tax=Flavihumibacter profundi TaxID=2716883 RepID=UPI001CC45EE8|nr:glycosyltransferase family 2 protein [Flavihumibacter profundi]MBZ5857993.1 glycosyltransferase [Flavihumibacter profundi]